MTFSIVGLKEIADRLDKLECENHRLKVLAGAAVALAAVALIFTRSGPGFAQSAGEPLRTITAYQYILRDAAGRERADLFYSDAKGSPMLTFLGPHGHLRLLISADDMGTQIVTYSPGSGSFQTKMTSFGDGAIVQASHFHRGTPAGDASLGAFKHTTNLEAEDASNYRTLVGEANFLNPATGKTAHTDAASIVMEKLGHLIWKAPPHGRRTFQEGEK